MASNPQATVNQWARKLVDSVDRPSRTARLFAEMRQFVDASLERERLYREDFTRLVAIQLQEHIDASLERERLFRQDFSGRIMFQLQQHLDNRMTRLVGAMERHPSPMAMPAGAPIYTHTLEGHRVFLDPSELFVVVHTLDNGEWERPVRETIRAILEPGDCFVDVGANIGLHTLLAAHLVGPKGRVIAIEPHPSTGRLLRNNLECNGLHPYVEFIQAAACQVHGGTRRFESFVEHTAMSGFALAPSRVAEFNGTVMAVDVAQVTLDQVLAERNLMPNMVKVDVEGFELLVLEGAQALLSNGQDIAFLIEHNPHTAVEVLGEGAPAAVLAHFFSNGFEAFLTTEDRSVPLTAEEANTSDGDILFLRPWSRYRERIVRK